MERAGLKFCLIQTFENSQVGGLPVCMRLVLRDDYFTFGGSFSFENVLFCNLPKYTSS